MVSQQPSVSRWPESRIEALRIALGTAWIRPGVASRALGIHRSTLHNYMADGRMVSVHLGGSKQRSVSSADVLLMIMEELDHGSECPPVLAEQVRTTIRRCAEQYRVARQRLAEQADQR